MQMVTPTLQKHQINPHDFKKEINMFEYNGLTSEEYSDTLGMCVNWYNFERHLFNGADKDDSLKSAHYNIVSLNPMDVFKMTKVLRVTPEARTVTRLSSVFHTIKIRLGDKKIKRWTKSYRKSLLSCKYFQNTKEDTSALFREHPYVILIPILTSIFMNDMVTKQMKF